MTPQNGETRSWRGGTALLMAAGVYKTLVGVLCMVVVAADMAFLVAGSAYLWREGWRE